jgi:putative spermidine/putrescine transport system substrate-binding protein
MSDVDMQDAFGDHVERLRRQTLSREELLRKAAALGVVCGSTGLLAGPALGGSRRAAAATLTLQVWPGSYEEMYKKYVFDPFAKQNNITIKTSGTNEFADLGKVQQEVKSGSPKLDASVFLPSDVIRGTHLGVFERIPSNLPNLKNVYPFAKKLMPYGVAYLVYTYAYGKRTDIKKTHGIDPKSWKDLWDPRLKKSITIGSGQTTYLVQSINMMLHGRLSPVGADAWDQLHKLAPNVHSLQDDPAQQQDLLVRSEAPVAVLFDGRIWTMQDAGVPVHYVIPTEGIYASADYVAVLKGSKNKDLAFRYIDFALSPKASHDIGVHLHYGPTNRTVKFAPREAQRVVSGPAQVAKLRFENGQYVAAHTDEWTQKWNEWRASL